ncbi:MAG: MerR family transcriptional regulator [Acetobacteraceae bacterium]|nr:MerR family transcriptional regulator [Acetobacteraceae bacterium]
MVEAAGCPEVTPRFVRFLISEGIINPPSGGRAHADYGEAHLRGILTYLRLRGLGFSLTQVREIFRSGSGETVPIEIAPGLSLHVDLKRLNRTLSPAEAAERVSRVLAELLETLNADGDGHAGPD